MPKYSKLYWFDKECQQRKEENIIFPYELPLPGMVCMVRFDLLWFFFLRGFHLMLAMVSVVSLIQNY
jgi:hypothetical protein